MRRGPDAGTPSQLAAAAAAAVAEGADTVAICTDAEATPQGLADLFAVCRGVPQPVVARDWYLHPIQVWLQAPCLLMWPPHPKDGKCEAEFVRRADIWVGVSTDRNRKSSPTVMMQASITKGAACERR